MEAISNSHYAIQPGDKGIHIQWFNDMISFYHYVWLRDCCYCGICGDSYSSNRFLHPNQVSLDVRPKTLELVGSNELHIVWMEGSHQSSYKMDWLRQYGYSDSLLRTRFHQPKLWDETVVKKIPTVDYLEVVNSEHALLELYRHLRDFGFVIVKSGPITEQGAESVAGLIGQVAESAYGKYFDLSPKSSHKTAGNTMFPIPPHTDEAYRACPPGINILHCIQPARTQGESILVDGFNLGEILRNSNPDQFDLLVKQPQSYHRVVRSSNIDQRTRAPVFTLDENKTIVGFRFHPRSAAPLDVPSDLFLDIYAANRRLCELMLNEQNQAKFRLEAGDAVLFDNHRVMHARSGFDDESRKLKICNVSKEQFHENFRLTAYRLGFVEESQQILAAGVSG